MELDWLKHISSTPSYCEFTHRFVIANCYSFYLAPDGVKPCSSPFNVTIWKLGVLPLKVYSLGTSLVTNNLVTVRKMRVYKEKYFVIIDTIPYGLRPGEKYWQKHVARIYCRSPEHNDTQPLFLLHTIGLISYIFYISYFIFYIYFWQQEYDFAIGCVSEASIPHKTQPVSCLLSRRILSRYSISHIDVKPNSQPIPNGFMI